jgi:UDP-N-acetylmuramate dehydrogenase
MKIQENFSLKKYNTFNFDIRARQFCEIASKDELLELFSSHEIVNNSFLVIGEGSNILFKNDFDGLIIKMINSEIDIIKEDDLFVYIKAGAGVQWDSFVEYTVKQNLGGIENLSLIPGTVGASPVQNIGAYGQEVKDSIEYTEGLNISEMKKMTLTKEECKFGYRNSIFKNVLKNKFIVTNVVFKLAKNPMFNINYGSIKSELAKMRKSDYSLSDVRDAVISIRNSKLPDPVEIGSAGSFFKNPEINKDEYLVLKEKYPDLPSYELESGLFKIPAGWLIEQCGWKGKRIGDAGCFPKQALILCNYGSARPNEIIELAESIKSSVYKKFRIAIHEEVNII